MKASLRPQAVRQAPPWAIDAWGLGCLLQEAFGGRELARTEDLRSTENIPKAILQVRCRQALPDIAC